MRAQLVVFAAGPLVGDLVSSLPRIPAYRSLTVIQRRLSCVSLGVIAERDFVVQVSE
jgi:iron-regulated transporter 1